MTLNQVRRLRILLREIERRVAITLKEQTQCCGVTAAQCHVLLEFEGDQALTNLELSQRLQLDSSTLSRTVDGLVKGGQIDRQENPQNRRSTLLRLTELGKETQRTINEGCDRFYQDFFQPVPEEKHDSILESIEIVARLFAESSFQPREGLSSCSCQKS